MHFHLPEALASAIPLRRSTDDEVGGVQWMEMGEHNPLYCALYASHKEIADTVLRTQGGRPPQRGSTLRLTIPDHGGSPPTRRPRHAPTPQLSA